MKAKAKQFVESTIRAERPKLQTRMNKDKENYKKRQQAFIEAESKRESMDVKDVLSTSLLQLAQAKTARNKPSRIQDGGALAFLVKDNAELCRQHNIKFEASQAPNTPKRRTKRRVSSRDLSSSAHKERPSSILRASRSARYPRASSKLQQRAEATASRPVRRCVSIQGEGRRQRQKQSKEEIIARRRRLFWLMRTRLPLAGIGVWLCKPCVGFQALASKTHLQRCA